MHMLGVMDTLNLTPASLALKALFLVGGPVKAGWRKRLKTKLGVEVTAGYGLSDVTAPGIGFECGHDGGLHVSEDHFIFEIINPETGEPSTPREEGEIVLTTLTGRAFPLVRFRTGDLGAHVPEPCPCGRTFSRMSETGGYTGNVLTVAGIKVHPLQVKQILQPPSDTPPPRFVIRLHKEDYLDRMEIWLEMTERLFSDEVKQVENDLKRLRRQVFQMLGLEVSIRLVEASTLDLSDVPIGGVLDER
jgi:phenylacetate-CoA ligase